MKLCIVTAGNFFSDYGGGQSYVRSIVHAILQQQTELRVELSILSISPSFEFSVAHKKYHGSTLYEIHPQGDLQALIQNINPDIVHAHGEKVTIACICQKLHIPCIVTAHHGGIVCPAGSLLNTHDAICTIAANQQQCLPCYLRNIRFAQHFYPLVKHIPWSYYLNIGQWIQQRRFIPLLSPVGEAAISVQEKIDNWQQLKNNATCFIAPSQAIAQALLRNGVEERKIHIVPHGVEVQQSKFSKKNRTDNIIRFYYVGRICYVKGIHILMKAFHQLKEKNIELHLIGGTGNKNEIRYQKQLQRHYRHDQRIVWHGKKKADEVFALVNTYDVLVHPAIYLEVFGLNIAEALSMGKPVIATRCGGAEMQIKNGLNGILVQPNNANALAEAMLQFLSHPIIPQGQPISLSQHVQTLFALYQSLL